MGTSKPRSPRTRCIVDVPAGVNATSRAAVEAAGAADPMGLFTDRPAQLFAGVEEVDEDAASASVGSPSA
jgi:hypothetical protein